MSVAPEEYDGGAEEDASQPWESDHTALVHVLWRCDHQGLTLTRDFDKIASEIMRSQWMQAVKQHAKDDA